MSAASDGEPRVSRVFGLDLLRCIAVLMVLGAHALFLLRPLAPALQPVSILGYLGVELFFVLSGFLIGGIILRSFSDRPDLGTLRAFWIRRWFRTLPNYYLFLAVNLLLYARQLHVQGASWTYGLFLQNLDWPCPDFFNESWSLTVEEWFYLLFPLLLFLAMRLRREKRMAVLVSLAALFLLSTGARVVAVEWGHPTWDAGLRKVVLYRFDGLMIGVLAALAKTYRPAAWEGSRGVGVVAGSVLLVLVSWFYLAVDRNASFFARTFLFSFTSFSVFCFLPALDAWRGATGGPAAAVRRVSLWSYSLYLCRSTTSWWGSSAIPSAAAQPWAPLSSGP